MDIASQILSRIEKSSLQEIDSKRCFVVSREDFYDMFEILNKAAVEIQVDYRFTKANKLEAFQFSVSSVDEPRYMICTPAIPVLDDLWDKKFKGDKK